MAGIAKHLSDDRALECMLEMEALVKRVGLAVAADTLGLSEITVKQVSAGVTRPGAKVSAALKRIHSVPPKYGNGDHAPRVPAPVNRIAATVEDEAPAPRASVLDDINNARIAVEKAARLLERAHANALPLLKPGIGEAVRQVTVLKSLLATE